MWTHMLVRGCVSASIYTHQAIRGERLEDPEDIASLRSRPLGLFVCLT